MIKRLQNKISASRSGAIALILVVMITALTITSLVIISLNNVTDLIANYQVGESESVAVNMDACLDDALGRIASSTAVLGSYYLDAGNVTCAYEIGAIVAGLKTVTSTASTTSGLGSWYDSVVVKVNVSTTPISINQYKSNITEYDANFVCGNDVREGSEVCDDGNLVDEGCGNGATETADTYCNSTCTAEIVIADDEACDDENTDTEACGNGVLENGNFCNADCSAEIVLSEVCDHTIIRPVCPDAYLPSVGSCGGKAPYCHTGCGACVGCL